MISIYFGALKDQISKPFERKIVNIFLYVSLNMFFGCSEESSHRDGSSEYPQHMFWLRNEKIFFNYTGLPGGLHMYSN